MKNKRWICKADEELVEDDEEEEEESTDDDENNEDEDKIMNFDQVEPELETATVPIQDSFSRLKQLLMNQFNHLEDQNQSHHQYYVTHFQHIETQVNDIQSKMGDFVLSIRRIEHLLHI